MVVIGIVADVGSSVFILLGGEHLLSSITRHTRRPHDIEQPIPNAGALRLAFVRSAATCSRS